MHHQSNMMMRMPHNNNEEIARLQEALAHAQHERETFITAHTALTTSNAALVTEHEALRGELRVTRTERDLLKEQLAAFMRRLFTAKSEARGSEQKDMFLNEAEALAGTQTADAADASTEADQAIAVQIPAGQIRVDAHVRLKRGRKPLDPALPREVMRHELPVSERTCPHDGATLTEIGVEASEQLDIIPQQVRVIRHERVKYACPCCDQGLRVTPVPPRIIPKGLLTEAALAWVISAKLQDALPLYRQAALLGRFGGNLSRNTLATSVVRVGEAVQPVINLLRDVLLESPLILGDETELQVLKEPGRAAQTKSYMWVQMTGSGLPSTGSGPPGAGVGAGAGTGAGPAVRLFAYAPSRSGATARELYAGVAPGTALMTDGYDPYDGVARHYGLLHLACWAHARRRFVEALAVLPKDQRTSKQPAAQFIAAIAELYAVEARARDLPPAERLSLRNLQSRPVLERIATLAQTHQHAVLPASLLGKAIHYLLGQWPKLIRFVDDGLYPIDNNLCENAIRPFVIGRRNWLFADTVGGATASANLYSLIETAKANGIEPFRYLRALFKQLPRARSADDYAALLPWLGSPLAANL